MAIGKLSLIYNHHFFNDAKDVDDKWMDATYLVQSVCIEENFISFMTGAKLERFLHSVEE
ncbi:hypothetical protein DERP_011983 [Dermatophagoides pteronyssinus]|uniref:Uncharacterized protein n=1 Tax=Dermatophagoides pteronyssinus TaxID=6956 RepID=A0ABQ8IVI7_DERPT|nr:hypothetical protein DERP_011983 [Dermatophagoides pteronyssinus]